MTRPSAALFFLVSALCARAGPLCAQILISPSFQGISASNGMTAGNQLMLFSAPQLSAAVMRSGGDVIQSGFFGFLEGPLSIATARVGRPIYLTIMTPVGLATAYLPADSVPDGAVVSLSLPAAMPAVGDGGLTGVVDSAVQFNSDYQPVLPTALTISYADAGFTGGVPEQFAMARFDSSQNRWVPLVSAVDSSNRVVRAQAGTFSLFQLTQRAPSLSVSEAKVFPNPLRPALGQRAMTFTDLPAGSRLRIYTLKGVQVKELAVNAAGMSSWDGTNESGAEAASGVYFVYVQGAGERRTLSVAIER